MGKFLHIWPEIKSIDCSPSILNLVLLNMNSRLNSALESILPTLKYSASGGYV